MWNIGYIYISWDYILAWDFFPHCYSQAVQIVAFSLAGTSIMSLFGDNERKWYYWKIYMWFSMIFKANVCYYIILFQFANKENIEREDE